MTQTGYTVRKEETISICIWTSRLGILFLTASYVMVASTSYSEAGTIEKLEARRGVSHAGILQPYLVLHQGNERRYDNADFVGNSWQDLVAHTLACTETRPF